MLIATDGSEVAQRGVDHGLSLAKALGANVVLLTVTEPFPFSSRAGAMGWAPGQAEIDAFEQSHKQQADAVLAVGVAAAGKIGVEIDALHVPDAHPAEAIVATANERGCSLIVMSSHGRRGIGRLFLGSQTSEVLAHSRVPVLVVR